MVTNSWMLEMFDVLLLRHYQKWTAKGNRMFKKDGHSITRSAASACTHSSLPHDAMSRWLLRESTSTLNAG